MKNIWYVINIALVALALLGGYNSLSPEKLPHTNPDAILCGVILLVMPLFAIGSVRWFIRRWNHNRLARPSLGRNPLNWWHDPLQSLFISTCFMAAMAIGSAVRHPTIGSVGFDASSLRLPRSRTPGRSDSCLPNISPEHHCGLTPRLVPKLPVSRLHGSDCTISRFDERLIGHYAALVAHCATAGNACRDLAPV